MLIAQGTWISTLQTQLLCSTSLRLLLHEFTFDRIAFYYLPTELSPSYKPIAYRMSFAVSPLIG